MLVNKLFWPALLIVLIPLNLVATDSVDTRSIELRVTDHQAGIEDFRSLGVRLKSIGIHTKGAPRRQGWLDLRSEYSSIDIVPLKNGRYVTAGSFNVPVGIYDAVKVQFESVDGELISNITPKLSADDTTVAVNIDLLSGAQAAVVLDLYVESLTDHEPDLYVVKVKEIRVEK